MALSRQLTDACRTPRVSVELARWAVGLVGQKLYQWSPRDLDDRFDGHQHDDEADPEEKRPQWTAQ